MGSLFLRDVPDDLHRKIKAEAALLGISLKNFIIKVLTEYLKNKQER